MRGHVTCALCETVCTVSSLKAHIRFRHWDERPFHCHLCDSSFKNAYDLHKHVETHNDSGAYSREVEGCGFTSRTLQTLREHYKRVHVGKPCVTPLLETAAILMASAENPCSLGFLNQSNGILKYKCHIYQKRGTLWSYTLTLHLRKAHKLSSHSRFRYIDDEGHRSLNLAAYNAITGFGKALSNKMIKSKVSPSHSSFEREGGDPCRRDTSTVEVLFSQLQPWPQTPGENLLLETETSLPETVYSEPQPAVQPFKTCCTSAEVDEATAMNVREKLIEMELGLGIQVVF